MNRKSVSAVVCALLSSVCSPFSATISVTSTADSGPGTLRQAILDAAPGDTVEMATAGMVQLSSTLAIDKPLRIRRAESLFDSIVLTAAGVRILNITAGPTTLSGLVLSNGWDNTAGGGIHNTAELLVDSCKIVSCDAQSMGGGVVNASGASLRLKDSVISGCSVSGYGGGAVYNNGLLVVNSSLFLVNSAYNVFFSVGDGGALRNDFGHVFITNSTFAFSTANNYGGAIFTDGGRLTVVNCTITGSRRYDYYGNGAGIYNAGSIVSLFNSIVANSMGFPEDIHGGIDTGDYNLISRTNGFPIPGTHNLFGVDPLLDFLKDNGGPTPTMALAGISPAVDAANPAMFPLVDQRGVARPAGAAPDIGAFEGSLPTNHPPVVTLPIPDAHATFGQILNHQIPAGAFADLDEGQTLTFTYDTWNTNHQYPLGVWVEVATHTLTGTVAAVGTFAIKAIATDDGVPPLSVTNTFSLLVPKVPITASVRDVVRPAGSENPPFDILYHGLLGLEFESIETPPTASTTATADSPPGTYPVTLSGGSDEFYEIVGWTNGTLTVLGLTANHQLLHSFGFTNKLGRTPGSLYEGMGWIRGSDGRLYGTTVEGGYGGLYLPAAGVVFRMEADGTGYEVLHHFGDLYNGARPNALAEADDGVLYGTTTELSPSSSGGTVFKLNKDGSGFSVLKYLFDVQTPGFLMAATNNFLYGLAYHGSTNILFRLDHSGGNYSVVHAFNPFTAGKCMGVIQASDGLLYGITATPSGGAIFRMQLDGSGYTVLHTDFSWVNFDQLTLREGSDGVLYGTSLFGASFAGSIFKLNKDGSGYTELSDFANADHGLAPVVLIEGADGQLYGAADSGGTNGFGTIFRLGKDGSGFTVLSHLGGGVGRPEYPTALLQGAEGRLYAVSRAGGTGNSGTIFAVNTNGTGSEILWSFTSTGGDGASAGPPLIQAGDGMFYGVTSQGGGSGVGALYRVSLDGSGYELVYHFDGRNGSNPRAGLLEGSDGFLYGTTKHGGADSVGSIFKVNRDGTGFTTLHEFEGLFVFPDGRWPVGALIEGTNGALYGLNEFGGANNRGTLFRINRDGTGFSVLRHLTLPEHPTETSGLLLGSDGAIYGTVTGDMTGTNGVVFRVQLDGSGYTVLRDFSASAQDGTRPVGALIEVSNGFYGVTSGGGTQNRGTVFRMNMDGTGYQVVHHLGFGPYDARFPYAGLVLGPDGALYGTATEGGSFGNGAAYRLRPDGSDYCVIHHFEFAGGYYPRALLLKGNDGSLYGTTAGGGHLGLGTVFRIAVAETGNTPPALAGPIPNQTTSTETCSRFHSRRTPLSIQMRLRP